MTDEEIRRDVVALVKAMKANGYHGPYKLLYRAGGGHYGAIERVVSTMPDVELREPDTITRVLP